MFNAACVRVFLINRIVELAEVLRTPTIDEWALVWRIAIVVSDVCCHQQPNVTLAE